MKRYSQLADLESLLLDIQDENIRAYAADAIASYSAGAYRSAIVSIWIAVVYDIYQKFRYLAETFGDKAAEKCLKEIEEIRSHKDKKQVAIWERTILFQAFNNVKMLTSTEYEHLDRIQEDRHRCAHPVLDKEGFLFQPSPELVRTHIRTAIEVLFSQPPVIGKALSGALERDVEGRYFPDNLEGVRNLLIGRHLPASEKYRSNLFIFCLKKILYDEPFDEKFIKRYMLVFECTLEEHRDTFKAIDRKKIKRIIEKAEENRYIFLSELFLIEAIIYEETSNFIMEKLKNFAINNSGNLDVIKYLILALPEIQEFIFNKYLNMKLDEKISFISELSKLSIFAEYKDEDLLPKLVKTNISIFIDSPSFDDAKEHIKLIYPIFKFFTIEDINYFGKQVKQKSYTYDMNQVMKPIIEESGTFINNIINGVVD